MKNNVIILFLIFISSYSFAQEKNYNETELSISTNSETIKGTLLTPISKEKKTLIILIPGSGPTDRNGNNSMMKNNSLKFLTEDLIKKNIATYRYDKSVLSFTKDDREKIDSLTINVFINEAKAVISYFKKDNNYSKIIVAGHSQGSLVGMIAANNSVDGFISLAGAGRTIDNILVEQIEKQAPYLKDETVRIVNELKKGNLVNDYDPMLNSLFNKSVQSFLISWIKLNPQEELKKLTIPILVINGSKDIQVSTTEAELLHKANKNSQLYLVENMNHLFKKIKGDINENMGSYNNPNLPVMEELTNIITTFVNGIK